MKKGLRIFLVVLCLLQVLMLAACGNKGNEEQTTTPSTGSVNTDPSTTENTDTPEPEGLNYGGQEFVFYSRTSSGSGVSQTFACESGENIEQQGTYQVLSEMVVARNLEVENKYGIKIKCEYVTDNGINMTATLGNLIASGDNIYDVVLSSPYRASKFMSEGQLHNWRDSSYINVNDSWWNKNVMLDTAVLGKNYVAVSDLCISTIECSTAILFNKDLADIWDVGDLYQMVRDGEWTIEALKTATAGIYQDLNSSQTLDKEDYFGFTTDLAAALRPYIYAANMKIVDASDSSGIPRVSINDGEGMVNLVAALDNLFNSGSVFTAKQSNFKDAPEVFAAGRAVFTGGTISQISGQYVDIEHVGVLPYPKLEADASENPVYKSTLNGEFSVMIIPNTATQERLDCIAVIINAMSRRSTAIGDKLFTNVHQLRSSDTQEDAEMMAIIKAGSTVDMSQLYTADGDVNGKQPINNIMRWIYEMASPNFSTWWASHGNGSVNYFNGIFAAEE